MKKKEKIERNISEFANWKCKFTLTKPRGLLSIGFYVNPEDSWFLEVVTYKTKSGAISETSMIIEKDVATWKSHMSSSGYTIVK
jgi:hypothetical protein